MPAPNNADKLTRKQSKFVAEAANGKTTLQQAAINAGYSPKVAHVQANENLKKPKIARALNAVLEKQIKPVVKKAINTYEEFTEQLEFAKKTRVAAQEWLTHPEDPDKFIINPRADEIDIVYFDFEDCTQNGEPKRKTASLQEILARLEGTRYESSAQFIKTVDLRDWALKTVDKCESCIDKFAKLGGDYQQDRANETDAEVKRILAIVDSRSQETGQTRSEVITDYIAKFSDPALTPPTVLSKLKGIRDEGVIG